MSNFIGDKSDHNLVFLTIEPSGSPKYDLLDALCTSVVPPFHPPSLPNPNIKPSRQQEICLTIENSVHTSALSFSHNSDPEVPQIDHHDLKSEEEHSTPRDTAQSSRFTLLYVLVLIVFFGVVLFLLAKPIVVVLTNMGLLRGGRRVYGVRDMETGFGFGKQRGRFGKTEKNSMSVPHGSTERSSRSGSEEEGFVVLAGGGAANLGGRRGKKG